MILDEIIDHKKGSLPRRKANMPLAKLEQKALEQRPPRDFIKALKRDGIKLIAEVKRASPSRGLLAPGLDAPSLARTYRSSGAAAISVLTDSKYFKGSLTDLEAVRAAVDIPLLRKDFIVDPYQVYEARASGADAVLLIAAASLAVEIMRPLMEAVQSLGMQSLVEVHNEKELDWVLTLKPKMIGINNRDLSNFKVDLNTTLKLRERVPRDVVVVSESGIHTRADVLKLQKVGVDAILVGEALVTSGDPAAKIHELIGR